MVLVPEPPAPFLSLSLSLSNFEAFQTVFQRHPTASRLEREGGAVGLISQCASVCDTFTFLQFFFFFFFTSLPSSLLSC